MRTEDVKRLRLQGQYLTDPAAPLQAARELCGLQAQVLSAALHALRIRTTEPDTEGLIKGWTLRGTLHLFPESDLPVYIRRRGMPEEVTDAPWYQWLCDHGHPLEPGRARRFARLITDAVADGTENREALRLLCREAGMTESEEAHVFHSWGGLIAALMQLGVICFRVREEKAYRLCPDFTPLSEGDAELELARRYFTHYGPATLRDAAYFFRVPQAKVKGWLNQLPARSFRLEEQSYHYIPRETEAADIPPCLLLAGFDQLMLGYRKEDNPFLPREHLRSVFSLAGGVAPAILLNGRVVGKWKHQAGKVAFTAFEPLSAADKRFILDKADSLWTLKKVEWG